MAFASLILFALTVTAPPAVAKVDDLVIDEAAALTSATRIALANQLYVWRATSGHRLLVVVRSSRAIPGALVTAEESHTAVLEVILDEPAINVHVGHALASRLPPGAVWRVVHVVMRPRLLSHDVDGAVLAGARSIITLVDPRGLRPSVPPPQALPPWLWFVAGAVALAVVAIGLRYPELALLLVLGGWYGVYRGQRPGHVLTREGRPGSRTRSPSHRSHEARARHR